MPRRIAFILALGLAGLSPAGGATMAGQPARVAVGCAAETGEPPARLCPILIETLAEAAGGAVADDGTTRAELFVRLEVSLAGDSILRGRLLWRRGRDGAETAGPEVTLRVSDGGQTDSTLGNFARALVKVSELPLGE